MTAVSLKIVDLVARDIALARLLGQRYPNRCYAVELWDDFWPVRPELELHRILHGFELSEFVAQHRPQYRTMLLRECDAQADSIITTMGLLPREGD